MSNMAKHHAEILAFIEEGVLVREEEIRAGERARIRGWLGQQAGKAERESRSVGDKAMLAHGARKAFKEAADYLKPTHVKAGLAAKRAARKAVDK